MSDKVRKSLLGLSGRNRRFMDSLVTLIWCGCKEGNYTKSTSWEDWCDTELNIVYETFYLPAEMKRRKAQRDAIFEARKAGKVSNPGLFDG